MQEIKLSAKKREITGRKVKQLRAQGILPANVYGKKTKSLAVALDQKEFTKVFQEAGETGVVKLLVESEKEERPILIQNVQKDPVSDEPLHVDLRQIILTEKVTAQIPVELEAEAPAVQQKLGILIQIITELEVEALPMDLPEKFFVNISKLAKVGDEFTVKNLAVDRKKIDLKAEETLVLAKIEPLAAEEVVAPKPEEVAAEGEAPVTEGGEAPKTEEKKEEKKE